MVLLNYWSEGDDSDLKLFENELSDRGVQYKTLNFSEEYLKELALNGADAISDSFFDSFKIVRWWLIYFRDLRGCRQGALRKINMRILPRFLEHYSHL